MADPRRSAVPLADRLEMKRRYEQGESLAVIAAAMSYGKITVRKYLLWLGVRMRPAGRPHGHTRLSYEELVETHRLRLQGLTYEQIGERLGLSIATVYERLQKLQP